MSKAMRIVDREIIERQVVNAWKEKSEANFIRIILLSVEYASSKVASKI